MNNNIVEVITQNRIDSSKKKGETFTISWLGVCIYKYISVVTYKWMRLRK